MNKCWIFDFDGTLINSRPLLNKCFEKVTKKLAPERLQISKNILIGPPLRQTVIKILGDPNHQLIDEFIKCFVKIHDENAHLGIKPYPFVHETLLKLHKKGSKMAIATNKRLVPTLKIIKYLKWYNFFSHIECSDSDEKVRDKKQMVERIICSDNDFKTSYMVGDTKNDGLSAKENKILFIKASYGYGSKEIWKNIPIHKSINNLREIEKV